MNVIRNREFVEEEVILDHNTFDGCAFRRCILIYHGHGPTDLLNNEFSENSWRFRGPADRFLRLLQQMNSQIGKRAEVIDLVSNTIFGKTVPLHSVELEDGPHLVLDFGRIPEELADTSKDSEEEATPAATTKGPDEAADSNDEDN